MSNVDSQSFHGEEERGSSNLEQQKLDLDELPNLVHQPLHAREDTNGNDKKYELLEAQNAQLKTKIELLEAQLALKETEFRQLQLKYDELANPREDSILYGTQHATDIEQIELTNHSKEAEKPVSNISTKVNEKGHAEEETEEKGSVDAIEEKNLHEGASGVASRKDHIPPPLKIEFDSINDLEEATVESNIPLNPLSSPSDQQQDLVNQLTSPKLVPIDESNRNVLSPEVNIPPRSSKRTVPNEITKATHSRLPSTNSVSSSLYSEVKSPLKSSPIKMRSPSAAASVSEDMNLSLGKENDESKSEEQGLVTGETISQVIMGSSPRRKTSRKNSPLSPTSPLRKEAIYHSLSGSHSGSPSINNASVSDHAGSQKSVQIDSDSKPDVSTTDEFYFNESSSSLNVHEKSKQPYYLSSANSPIRRRELDPDPSSDIYSAYLGNENQRESIKTLQAERKEEIQPKTYENNALSSDNFGLNILKGNTPILQPELNDVPPQTPVLQQTSLEDAPQLESPTFESPFNMKSQNGEAGIFDENDSLYSYGGSNAQANIKPDPPATPVRGNDDYDDSESGSSIVQTPTQKRFASPFVSPTRPANSQLPLNALNNTSLSPMRTHSAENGRNILHSPQNMQFQDNRSNYSPSLNHSAYSNGMLSPSLSTRTPRSNFNAFVPISTPQSGLSPQQRREPYASSNLEKVPDYLSSEINNTKIVLTSIVDPEALSLKQKERADPRISFSVEHKEGNAVLYKVKQPYSVLLSTDHLFRSFDYNFYDMQGIPRRERIFSKLPELPLRKSLLELDPVAWDACKTTIRMYVDELCRLMKQISKESEAWSWFNSFFRPWTEFDDPSEIPFYFVQSSKMKKSGKLWVASVNSSEHRVTLSEWNSKTTNSEFSISDLLVTIENQVLTFQRKKKNVFKTKISLYAESVEDGNKFVSLINKYSTERDEEASVISSEASIRSLTTELPSTPKSQSTNQETNNSGKKFFRRTAKSVFSSNSSHSKESAADLQGNQGSGSTTPITTDTIFDFKAMPYNTGVLSSAPADNIGATLSNQSPQQTFTAYSKAIDPANKFFGSTLEKGLELSPDFEIDGKKLPSVVYRSIDYLTKQKAVRYEGIFRLNGMMAEVNKIQQIFNEEHDCDYFELPDPPDVHSVATLLKRYLRTLQIMIIPDAESQEIISLCELTDYNESVPKIRAVLQSLPKVNQDVLAVIFTYLQEVLKFKLYNKMSVSAISVLMAPNISTFDSNKEMCAEILINHKYYFEDGNILTEEERKMV